MSDPSFSPRNRCLLLGLAVAVTPLAPEDFLAELMDRPAGRPVLADVVEVPIDWLVTRQPSDYAQPAPALHPLQEVVEVDGRPDEAAAERELLETMLREAGREDDDLVLHSLRVGTLSEAIARELGADEAAARLLHRAAVLHDVGKVVVAPEILLKTERLSDEEYEASKLHTIAGAELLHGIDLPVMRLARELAQTHHERWNGTGYPDRLRGLEIPTLARVVAVADTFDALTHERPYKPAWSAQEAAIELDRQRGQLHEACVVDALFRVLHRAGVRVPGSAERAAA